MNDCFFAAASCGTASLKLSTAIFFAKGIRALALAPEARNFGDSFAIWPFPMSDAGACLGSRWLGTRIAIVATIIFASPAHCCQAFFVVP